MGSVLGIAFYVAKRALAFTLIFSTFAFLGNTLVAGAKSVHAGGAQPVFDFNQFAGQWRDQISGVRDRFQNIGSSLGLSAHADQTGRVVHVADGDTITVDLGGDRQTVRIIGVDTPETVKPGEGVQCYGAAASKHTKSTLRGHTVTLTYDRERFDKYKRTLAYVTYRDHDYGASLLRQGYARTLSIEPNTARASRYSRIERQAKAAGRGLWGACR